MSFQTDNPNIDALMTELNEGIVGMKKALADGSFQPHEVVDVVRGVNPAVADFLDQQFHALGGLYPEVKKLESLGAFGMMMQAAPYFAQKLMGMFA